MPSKELELMKIRSEEVNQLLYIKNRQDKPLQETNFNLIRTHVNDVKDACCSNISEELLFDPRYCIKLILFGNVIDILVSDSGLIQVHYNDDEFIRTPLIETAKSFINKMVLGALSNKKKELE